MVIWWCMYMDCSVSSTNDISYMRLFYLVHSGLNARFGSGLQTGRRGSL
jgi:hypothetical protein